jgi:hypothetical protein
LRIGEPCGIAVGRPDHRAHELAAWNAPPMQLHGLGCRAKRRLHGGAIPQHFLDRRWQQRRRRAEAIELRRMFEETEHRVVDQVGGRFVPREEQQLEERQHFRVAEPLALHFRLDQPREEVVARLDPARRDLEGEIALHLGVRLAVRGGGGPGARPGAKGIY